ncbi:hypothetical protein F4703DRAFT_1795975 [Phycomyces blakesleeanus]
MYSIINRNETNIHYTSVKTNTTAFLGGYIKYWLINILNIRALLIANTYSPNLEIISLLQTNIPLYLNKIRLIVQCSSYSLLVMFLIDLIGAIFQLLWLVNSSIYTLQSYMSNDHSIYLYNFLADVTINSLHHW